jgi:hypothetical protein
MTDAAELERRYRRWLRWYPATFRREHEAEMLAVLIAGARKDQRRPELVECIDLVSGALSMHLRPRVPRSNRGVFTAIRLMYLGAVVELATAIVILATVADVKSNAARSNPGFTNSEWRAAVIGQIAPNEVGAILAVAFWLWMAWSIGRGHRWVRIVFPLFFALNMFGLVNGLVSGSAVYARPDLAIATVLCLIELACVVVIFRARIGTSQSGTSRRIARS